MTTTEPKIVCTGRKVHLREITYRERRKYLKSPRVYFWFEKETVLDHLYNRRCEPHTEIKKQVLKQVLADMGVEYKKVRWSQYAGCTCPCSPGFILDEGVFKVNNEEFRHFDIYLDLKMEGGEEYFIHQNETKEC